MLKTEYKISPAELNSRLKWTLEEKRKHAVYKVLEFFIYHKGQVYLGFSGGKDSQMLDWLIDQIFKGRWKEEVEHYIFQITAELFPKDFFNKAKNEGYNCQSIIVDKIWGMPTRVFCDTGLEMPEIRKHVKTFQGAIWLKPKMRFPDVIKNIGVAVGSKMIATKIRRLKSYLLNPSSKNENTRRLYQEGIRSDGAKSRTGLSKFWQRLLDAPFKVSDKCCDVFKKEPFRRYEAETGRKPITATMVEESLQRRSAYLYTGCNSFESGSEMSRPFSIFTNENIWELAAREGVRFCEVYYDRVIEYAAESGILKVIVPGEKRTGCMFCLFGIHLENKKELNRFQRLALTHPKQWLFMVNVCGLGVVLEFIGVPYKITDSDVLKLKQVA